jgi:DNA polymerase-1
MIKLTDEAILLEDPAELPRLQDHDTIYLDVETTTLGPKYFGDKERGGFHPYHGDRCCGLAITADDIAHGWYIPMSVFDDGVVGLWLKSVLNSCRQWVNHNVKFDAHFVAEHFGFEPTCRFVDSLTMAKLIDTDRWNYGLKQLSREWLRIETPEQDRVLAYLKEAKSKDYGDVPDDILGEYAVADVLMNRWLYHYMLDHLPDQVRPVWETEQRLTRTLWKAERLGVCVDPLELKKEELVSTHKVIQLTEQFADLTGIQDFNSRSAPQVMDFFVNQLGLPILSWKEKRDERGNVTETSPTFDDDALQLYLQHPEVRGTEKQKAVQLIRDLREEEQHLSLYIIPYQHLQVDGVLHPDFNQMVRTGRMSCSTPNMQQLNKRAKKFIHPHPGMAFVSCDYSQIEFRLIVHYIKDMDAIKAYNEDPDTDFHRWVAEVCHVKRSPAKNINFMMAFGGGKRKTQQMLEANEDVIAEMEEQHPGMDMDEFHLRVAARAREIYATYHERLPGIKYTSDRAQQACRRRGFVFNLYKRRRHLQPRFARKAFNSIIQSSAADLIKERTVAIDEAIPDARFSLQVHDEDLFQVDVDRMYDESLLRSITDMLESPAAEISVPVRTSLGVSDRDWAEASGSGRREVDGEFVAGEYPRNW